VVLAHDWLTGMRGGERVLELLCNGFPDAPVCTLIYRPEALSGAITSHPVLTSRLQRRPGVHRYYRYLLASMPAAIEALRAPDADLVISTSHCVAKGLIPPSGARHLCYCFTPMRYAWFFYEEYFGRNPLKRALLKPLLRRLRDWDRAASDRVDRFVAISQYVRARIRTYYDRDADVVYPPVDLTYYTPAPEPRDPAPFDLVVSALVPYKKIDLAVAAYTRTGAPLKIVGIGTELDRLRRAAGPNIEFLGWQDYDTIRALYRTCRLLVFPGEEDFGLVPVEVQACGRPVVAFARGGALETVCDASGVFFHEQTEDALIAAVEQAAQRPWDPAAIRRNAEQFSIPAFIDGLDRSIRALHP